MAAPLVIVVGFIGKLPVAGMGLYNLHYIAGLQELGYEVHYVERQDYERDCYDPSTNSMTSDPTYSIRYLHNILPRYGIHRASFIDLENSCHISGWENLCSALDRAEFVLTLCVPTWFDELGRCARRAFLDGDPMFTQVQMLDTESRMAKAIQNYDILFTYAVRMGKSDCLVPNAGRQWLAARPVVSTSIWKVSRACSASPITNVMSWASEQNVEYQGMTFGQKNRELLRFIDLPKMTQRRFMLAVGGRAPRQELVAAGWELADPLENTISVEAYQRFIANSRADLGIAKHAYVASRGGWFSDRSTCYLAAGRPVLHQDTGCGDWLPTGEGVLLFSEMNELVEAIERLESDYEQHAQAARRVAEEHFEASKVLDGMLRSAGLR